MQQSVRAFDIVRKSFTYRMEAARGVQGESEPLARYSKGEFEFVVPKAVIDKALALVCQSSGGTDASARTWYS